MNRRIGLALCGIVLLASAWSAKPLYGQEGAGEAAPEMREMANAMKSMAEMCQTMMQREMQDRPFWIAVAAVLGTLLTLALLLFVVLEVQWVRFWSLRIKSERRHLGQ